MKGKKHIFAALTAAAMLSAGSMTAFAAEAPAAATGVCPYVCSQSDYCRDGLHGEDCPVYGCENHSEHCTTAGSYTGSRRGHHGSARTGSCHGSGRHHGGRHH